MKKLFVPSMLCVILLWVAGCEFMRDPFSDQDQHDNTLINVVCTTDIIADAVKAIGGSHVTVSMLMGPGIDPHLYRARERDTHMLANADVIFHNGIHLEGKLDDVLHAMQQTHTCVAIAEHVPAEKLIMTDVDGVYDPHIWHDVLLWADAVYSIAQTLAAVDQEHAVDYWQAYRAYKKQLQKLDEYIRIQTIRLKSTQRVLVTAHDAFSYFGRRYGFTVIGLQGVSTDVQVAVYDIRTLLDQLIERDIHVLFTEYSVLDRNLRAVMEAAADRNYVLTLDASLYSDTLGDGLSGADTYVAMMKKNIDTMVASIQRAHHAQ